MSDFFKKKALFSEEELMLFKFDFYNELLQLINQIPEGRLSSFDDIAKALGDVKSKNAIKEILNKNGFRNLKNKIVTNFSSEAELFKQFSLNKPLHIIREFQKNSSKKIIEVDKFNKYELVAGVDVSYQDDLTYAACVVLNKDYKIIDVSLSICKTRFPYIPGYLSFREGPSIMNAVKGVSDFDILIVNGHGIAHPRFFGLASHIGLILDKPTIGVSRRKLVGNLIPRNGSWDAVIYKGRIVGAKLRTYKNRNIYVSVGHKISLERSIEIIKNFCFGYDLPEPLRIAHILSKFIRKINYC